MQKMRCQQKGMTMKTSSKLSFCLCAVAVVFAIAAVSGPRTAWADPVTESSNATIAFDGGNLVLVGAPTIAFGLHTIDTATESFVASSVAPSLGVSDARGTGLGWNVTVALSAFQSGEANTLQGAALTMNNATVTSSGTGTGPTAGSTITLPSNGTAVPVENAALNAGLGVWSTAWLPADVSLNIPIVSQSVGSHQAAMTWTLTDAPA